MKSLQDNDAVEVSTDRALRHGLAKKLAVFAFISSFLTSLAVTWAAIDTTQQSLDEIIRREVPASLRRIAERQVGWIRSGERSLAALGSNRTDTRELASASAATARVGEARPFASGAESKALQERFFRWIESSAHFRGIAIFNPQGTAVTQVGEFDRAAFAAASASPRSPLLRLAPDSDRRFAVTPLGAPFPPGTLLVGDFLPFPLVRELAGESPLLGASVAIFDPLGAFAQIAADPRAPSVFQPDAIARLPYDTSGRVREYTNASGEHVIGCAIPFGLFDWRIAVEVPFDLAYEPVMSAAARMLAIELCIVLAFSFVAYRITTLMLRPIEVLSDGAQLIANGVIDHEIAETGRDDEIGLLARSFNQMMRNLRRDRREIEAAHRELMEKNLDLQRANEILNQLSITDGLTKVHNHRFFQDHLTREIKRVNRLNESLAIILIDVDDFKGLNDRYGHAAGDEVLMRLARIMESSVRETDLLARYGGEEFVIVASNTDSLGAYQLAEKIRINVEQASFTVGETQRQTRVTVSVGVAEYEGNRKNFFLAADRALYNAKAEGKNCVVVD